MADWGLVRSEVSDLTQTGDLFGSMPYMAPERFRGEANAASDIYSLGVTLYELLTLQRLFEVDDRVEMIRHISNQKPKPPRAIEPSISRDFETVVLKAIDKRPEARYRSAREFADDLNCVVEGRPVTARRLTRIVSSGSGWMIECAVGWMLPMLCRKHLSKPPGESTTIWSIAKPVFFSGFVFLACKN